MPTSYRDCGTGFTSGRGALVQVGSKKNAVHSKRGLTIFLSTMEAVIG
jgi:hypothetical protein